jgi:hypothetical protein
MGFQKPAKYEPPPKVEYVPCEVAASTRDAAMQVILDDIAHDPRTLQRTAGASDIGDPCEYCLGCVLAGYTKNEPPEEAWLPFVGKSVHAGLERAFHRAGLPWLPEQRGLTVGWVDGRPVKGTGDLYEFRDGVSIDWKIVGGKALTKVRRGEIKPVYRNQGQLYGHGWSLLGFEVNYVGIYFLPREARSLNSAVWWAEPYQERVALEVLARAEDLARRINTFGPEAIIPDLEKLPGCYDCKRWELP